MTLEYTSVDEIPDIVAGLHKTFNSGLTKPLKYRKDQLRRLYDLLEENESLLVKALYDDLRKPEAESLCAEIALPKEEILFFLKNLDEFSKPEKLKPRFMVSALDKVQVRHDPLGVVLIMGAWNYPIQLFLLPLIGAIAAGNTVLIKPSEIAVHTAVLLTSLLPRYLDQSSYRVVNGGVPETTRLLELRFDHICYTGNGVVGKIVMTAAAKHLTSVTLELGGKSPAIIADDVDIQVVANRVCFGKYYNCGQTCVGVDYVLIPESKLEPFLAAIQKSITNFFGENPKSSDAFARIIADRHFSRLVGMIENRTSGRIVAGGQHDKTERYIAPTVIAGIEDEKDPLLTEEIFGPILPVIAVKDVDAAIKYVNARDTPLVLYLFAKSSKIINKVLDNTRSGGVTVNDTMMNCQELNLPFGGAGASGIGSYHGHTSWLTFTHSRATLIRDLSLESAQVMIKYPPYSAKQIQVMRFFTMSMPWFKRGHTYRKLAGFFATIAILLGFMTSAKKF
ncbi:Aldehyde/histidinol dehydrogenase [Jimgerdemannia flammicorona]|uniref:Aldehyde/histidinol dehydrogenase n=2 Tax=Jimgerdemannia flammicorona TaxID=994334 RepID=A0A433QBU4_9FUNG|nr:Aldehyde/histidinol dehydrogenase [Jimgerdemannia flammicorona]RUS27209.1 Aldehyde/histidinol dehydrogenase [Jimgerdemannia flammicorona]